MKFLSPRTALFLVAPLLASAVCAQSVPDNRIAQPGTRLGRVFLGDSKSAVGRRLGKPTKTFNLGRGLTSQLWRSRQKNDNGGFNTLEVVYKRNAVVQIEGTSLIWTTPGGLSLGSARDDWKRIYGTPTQTTFRFQTSGGDVRKRYFDWKKAGIALELQMIEGEDEWTFQTLIIHSKNSAVIPDRGGTPEAGETVD